MHDQRLFLFFEYQVLEYHRGALNIGFHLAKARQTLSKIKTSGWLLQTASADAVVVASGRIGGVQGPRVEATIASSG